MSEPVEIEVGMSDGDLRLWRAQQAVRHGELRIAAQTANLTAMEGRATSILGWAVGIGTVAAGACAFGRYRSAAAVVAAMMFICAAIVASALRPKEWGLVGVSPDRLLDGKEDSELQVLEQIAADYHATVILNDDVLKMFGNGLRVAWIAFIATPFLALGMILFIVMQ